MATYDYNALRQQTLGSAQEEEAVTVNTRALIDKVLARYSGEHTTLRELLQNAADANATSVEIRYESGIMGEKPALFDLGDPKNAIKVKCRRMLVKNNGTPFREEDWQRLKRIAEGNPDETKIGAFGVGFYSVFADCEEPFVSSGSEAMAFYWKGNQLFTKRSKLPNHDNSTTFLLEFREPTEIPDLKILCKFLNTSLTFVKLNTISLFLDDQLLQKLDKKASPPSALQIPSKIDTTTQDKMMKIVSVTTETIQIDAKYMGITQYRPAQQASTYVPSLRTLFSRFNAQPVQSQDDGGLSDYTTKTIFLSVANAKVHTYVDRKFASELERATKKSPPKITEVSFLTMSKAEQDASEQDADIFENVVPNGGGKIFIGFPTHQTTGIKAHIAAHSVIPTVERENIDLNARIVKNWNVELLRTAGILARIVFQEEMSYIGKLAQTRSGSDLKFLYDHVAHIMKQFSFTDATPQEMVGRYIMSGFWNCAEGRSIEIFSTRGVLPAHKVRLSTDISFLESLPMLPEELLKRVPEFIQPLIDGKIIYEVTEEDILDELQNKALTGTQVTEFLKWISTKRATKKIDLDTLKKLLEAAVILDDKTGLPIMLGSIRHIVNTSKLSPDVPIPEDTLPFHITKNLAKSELDALGWSDLGVAEWLKFLVETMVKEGPKSTDFCHDREVAQQVLHILSKNWDTQTVERREYMMELLKGRTCIPTKSGMKKPSEAYFSTVKLFEDLPIINVNGVKEKVLMALGVRKTVELKIVFERLMGDRSNGEKSTRWSHVDLIKYLVSVRDDIPKEDIIRLRNTPICKAEAVDEVGKKKLYKVSDLYEPTENLRRLRLPILQWPGEWRTNSHEARFLADLGLKKFPTPVDLVELMASKDRTLAEAAQTYFIVNYHMNDYQNQSIPTNTIAFLPLEPSMSGSFTSTQLVTPAECYSNPKCAIMGFAVLKKELQLHADKFKVKPDPDMKILVDRVIATPPKTIRSAREQFTYLSSRLAEVMPHHVYRLGDSSFVPVPDTAHASLTKEEISNLKQKSTVQSAIKMKYMQPKNLFLGGKESQYADIFQFVDFGHEANAFLSKCGSKSEPTTSEVAWMLVKDPQRVLDIFQGHNKYLSVLRTLAEAWPTLKRDKELAKEMKRSGFLLASIDLPFGKNTDSGGDDEGTIKEYQLASARQIFVSDDFVSYNLFKNEILVAPQDDLLENFYISLGAGSLTSTIEEFYAIGKQIDAPEKAQKLHKLIVERVGIFLHSMTEPVRHDAKWLEKNITIHFRETIRLRRALKLDNGRLLERIQDSTAALTEERGRKILHLTKNYQTFDLCQILVILILAKPKLHSNVLLDSLLTTDLYTLKARGYNVDRILKANAAEARIKEQARLKRVEEQRKAIEEEERRYREQQKEKQKAATAAQNTGIQEHDPGIYGMPGQFNSPPRTPQPITTGGDRTRLPVGNSLFGRLSKHLGFDSSDDSQAKSPLLPPSPTPITPVKTPQPPTGDIQKPVTRPTQPFVLKANLQSAIAASRPHDSKQVFSKPETVQVSEPEQKSYCDSRHGHDLQIVGEISSSNIRLFVERNIPFEVRQEFIRSNTSSLHSFGNLLIEIAGIFNLPLETIHIFYDEGGPTIAFNNSGALFFNFRYYRELHCGDSAGARGTAARGGWSIEALEYWFVVACHELAHNLVSVHDSQHSFWVESFVQMFMAKVRQRINALEGGLDGDGIRDSSILSMVNMGRGGIPPPPPYTAGIGGF